jgi:hypothetical protein
VLPHAYAGAFRVSLSLREHFTFGWRSDSWRKESLDAIVDTVLQLLSEYAQEHVGEGEAFQ